MLYRTWVGLSIDREPWDSDYHTGYRNGLSAGNDIGAFVANGGNYYGTIKNNWIEHEMFYSYPGKAHILRLTAADLSGNPASPEGAPARTGYWVLKSLKNQFDAVNTFAGRTVITFDYPENIAP